jgi:tetratricopeptide (TPR) repeat protein
LPHVFRRPPGTVASASQTGKEPQVITDPTLLRIGEAVQLGHQGERERARVLFDEIWDEIGGEQGDALHRCTLAHAMADVQDDVNQELVWDQRALAAAGLLTEERVAEAGVALPVAALYPSLHLNLSECYRKLGDLERAREHLRQAQDTIGALGDDEYGQLIRDGLEHVAEQLR